MLLIGSNHLYLDAAMDWMFVSPTSLYIEVLTPYVMVCGEGTLGSWWALAEFLRVGHHHGIIILRRRDNRELARLLSTARRHLSASQEEGSLSYPTVQAPWSWSPSLQRLENINFWCLSHPACGILSWQLEQTNTDSLQILMLFDFINLKRGTRQKDLEIA